MPFVLFILLPLVAMMIVVYIIRHTARPYRTIPVVRDASVDRAEAEQIADRTAVDTHIQECIIAGEEGEKDLLMELLWLPHYFNILIDFYVPKKDKVTQIDLLVLSRKGIFVIEVKRWAGKIFGNKSNRHWWQIKPNGKNNLCNPILQNKMHIDFLAQYLNLPKEHFCSFVWFVGSGYLVNKIYDDAIIVHGINKEAIIEQAKIMPNRLTKNQVARAHQKMFLLHRYKILGKRKHLQYLQHCGVLTPT